MKFRNIPHYANEAKHVLLGNRKMGAISPTTSRPVGLRRATPTLSTIQLRDLTLPSFWEINSMAEFDQGCVGSCAHVTEVSEGCEAQVRIQNDKMIFFRWEESWAVMKNLQYASDNGGSFISSNLWYAQEHGFNDLQGNNYKAKKIMHLGKPTVDLFKLAIYNNHQIVTGASCGFPFVDDDFIFITKQKDFGHGFKIIGWNENPENNMPTDVFICETSWKDFGFKKDGLFFLKYEDITALYESYILQW